MVVLLDGSRSMTPRLEAALRVARALVQCSQRIEVSVFSTELACVTGELRAAGTRVIQDPGDTHGGGTRIGEGLAGFLRVREAMRALHRRSAGVVWPNPLPQTRDYAPEARAMQAAPPHIATFASATDAPDFARLAETVRLRW